MGEAENFEEAIMEVKEAILTKDPEKFKGRDGKEWWSLHYAPKEYAEYSWWETAVTREICPEVESLKKGDRIIVKLKGSRVVKVEKVKGEVSESYDQGCN
ncbi:MAG: hypothetical protein MRT15_11735 [archaeon YNP-LCB-003-016]|uniref:hypothetical protein n=1 Tax=Candidatus Culexarchaeum yellowstonense TaxID=2928963 RepID=UPI0026F18D0E|nr:hypothetical protein [Candidatus Culexarchaeum yellowstonense]MCR6693056.1 hypothetical protein [Candidatus Culexarchaeum yellowstonense]